MAGKVFIGTRYPSECVVTVNGKRLAPRNDLFNHSPSGFEWGYGGSGPAQLALAILAEHLGDDDAAIAAHQDFKWKVISRLPKETWTLTSEQIDDALIGARANPGTGVA